MVISSDTLAGKLIGRLIAREMLKNPVTQKAVAEMRAEIQAFLKQNPDAEAHAKKQLANFEKQRL